MRTHVRTRVVWYLQLGGRSLCLVRPPRAWAHANRQRHARAQHAEAARLAAAHAASGGQNQILYTSFRLHHHIKCDEMCAFIVYLSGTVLFTFSYNSTVKFHVLDQYLHRMNRSD